MTNPLRGLNCILADPSRGCLQAKLSNLVARLGRETKLRLKDMRSVFFRSWLIAVVLGLTVAGCVGGASMEPSPSPEPPTIAPTTAPSPTPPPRAEPFRAEVAMSHIEHLAGLGPREATSSAFAEAADWVADYFTHHGYRVRAEEFDVPAGNSWGVPVGAGTSRNVIADPPGFDAEEPHLVIGAHLDSVPQSPGAEDNASGVSVMLELARMVAEQRTAIPVRFIAFGAEEPRGQGDSWHHFGSQHHVAELDRSQREAIRAMVALDRVGVRAEAVPIGAGGAGTTRVRRQLENHAGDISVTVSEPNRTSDHWSFDKAGIPAARVGSVPFDGYHSPRDTPDVIDVEQLDAVGTLMWSWLRAQSA